MITFIIAIHIVVSLMLIGVVLVQSGKGTGFAEVFGMGGGMSQSLFGAHTGTFLTRLTTVLAVFFMISSLTLAIFMGSSKRSVVDKMGREKVSESAKPVEKVESGLPGKKSVEKTTSEDEGTQKKTSGESSRN